MDKLKGVPLNTIILVENTIKNMDDSIVSISRIKKKLSKQVDDITLLRILEYLDDIGKIYMGSKGITWTHNTNPKLQRAIRKGTKL